MWTKRTAILATIITLSALGGPAPAGRANMPNEAILGDFNDDGLTDEATLGAVAPDLCSTIVTFGTASGGSLPPVAFTYIRVGTGSGLSCPDIGAAFERNFDGRDDLIVGWSGGPPAGLTYNRLILLAPTFEPTTYASARIDRPTVIGTAVFGTDGRPTPYVVGAGRSVHRRLQRHRVGRRPDPVLHRRHPDHATNRLGPGRHRRCPDLLRRRL